MMYKPSNAQDLIKDAVKLLVFLKQQNIKVKDGLEVIELIDTLVSYYPDINIHSEIIGEEFKDYIQYVYKSFSTEEFNDTKLVLPYLKYNIRHGVYASLIGMMGEYISLKVVRDNFNSGMILQDKSSQRTGKDIWYKQSPTTSFTADIKISNTDWTNGPCVVAHKDWFSESKNSTRFHLVDIGNNTHIITSRSILELEYENHHKEPILISNLKKRKPFLEHDIRYITQSFL
jgi:hypothetical protein